jgi:hypothetical protein
MILEFLSGERIDQCQQSDEAFGHADCCGPHGVLIVDSACDSPWYPEFEKWGYGYNRQESPLGAAGVVDEIFKARRPFAFSWARKPAPPTNLAGTSTPGETQADQVAHMLLAIGYGIDKKTLAPALVIIDPHPFIRSDAAIILHAEYDGSAGAYTHWEDYVDIRPIIQP